MCLLDIQSRMHRGGNLSISITFVGAFAAKAFAANMLSYL